MITIVAGATTIQLTAQLHWADELRHYSTIHADERTLGGALVIESSTRVAGRPITLRGPERGVAVEQRSVLLALRTLVEADATMALTLHDGQTFATVRWACDGADPPIDAEPIFQGLINPGTTTLYKINRLAFRTTS